MAARVDGWSERIGRAITADDVEPGTWASDQEGRSFSAVSTDEIRCSNYQLRSPARLPPIAGGLAQGGAVSLDYDGTKVGERRVDRTQPFVFSADETADVGQESGTPVTADNDRTSSVFSGRINRAMR